MTHKAELDLIQRYVWAVDWEMRPWTSTDLKPGLYIDMEPMIDGLWSEQA
jgi:hypothetical protein